MEPKQLSKAQEKAKAFIDEHNVEKIVSEMLNSLVHARDNSPVIFMIKYLSNLVTEQELRENGIEVHGPLPQRVPIITYPKFDEDCDSLLKRHLSRELWSNMKKKSTSKGGNIQMCVKSGVQRPNCDVGILATDEEAYKMFQDLFGPIIKDLHSKFDFRYSYKFEEINYGLFEKQLEEMKLAQERVKNFQVECRRNFRGMPFSPLMTREAKLQVERKVVEVLGELYGKYNQLNKVEEEDAMWLKQIGINIERQPEHDAAGINDDWPIGRGVFIEDNRQFVVLCNFEDHIHIVILSNDDDKKQVQKSFQMLIKLNQTFEKINYATDTYFGNLTVSPKYLGTGLRLQCSLVFQNNSFDLTQHETVQQVQNGKSISIQQRKENGLSVLDLQSNQSLASNYNEVIQLADFLNAMDQLCELDEPENIAAVQAQQQHLQEQNVQESSQQQQE